MDCKTHNNTNVKLVVVIVTVTILFASLSASAVSGPYFGQTPPGTTPVPFAPEFIAPGDRLVTRISFSPDGNECFFSGYDNWDSYTLRMYYTECVNNVWTTPVLETTFFPGHTYRYPFFTADGNTLYFTSKKNGTYDIWVADRIAGGWSSPQVLPSPVNTSYQDALYSETIDGNAYFHSDRPGGQGGLDIWHILTGPPLQVENLGPLANSSAGEVDPFVSPDGRYILFDSDRPGGYGQGDVYVTLADANGDWETAVNLNQYGPGINTSDYEYSPFISFDRRYIFFTLLDYDTEQGGIYWVENPLYGDLYIDGIVNFKDFAILAEAWVSEPGYSNWKDSCDLVTDGKIDEKDLAAFCDKWLK